MAFWFNVSTGKVEDDESKSPQDRLMGPFDTHGAAEQALSHAKENTERWDAEDKAWDDPGARGLSALAHLSRWRGGQRCTLTA